jgi:hypothetical protein
MVHHPVNSQLPSPLSNRRTEPRQDVWYQCGKGESLCPFIIRESLPLGCALYFGSLNHLTNLNAASMPFGMSAFRGKPENIRSI